MYTGESNVAPAAGRRATLVCSGPSTAAHRWTSATGKKSSISANVTAVVASRGAAGPPDVTETA